MTYRWWQHCYLGDSRELGLALDSENDIGWH